MVDHIWQLPTKPSEGSTFGGLHVGSWNILSLLTVHACKQDEILENFACYGSLVQNNVGSHQEVLHQIELVL